MIWILFTWSTPRPSLWPVLFKIAQIIVQLLNHLHRLTVEKLQNQLKLEEMWLPFHVNYIFISSRYIHACILTHKIHRINFLNYDKLKSNNLTTFILFPVILKNLISPNFVFEWIISLDYQQQPIRLYKVAKQNKIFELLVEFKPCHTSKQHMKLVNI